MKLFLALLLLISFNISATSHGVSSTVAVVQAGNIIIVANKARKKIIIQNINGAGNVTVKLDSLPANDDDGHVLGTHEVLELNVTNAIFGKASSVGGDTISLIEILE